MDKPTANFIQIMRDRVESLRNQGDLNEATHAANALVDKCQQLLGPDLDTIDAFVNSLELRATIHNEMENYNDAIEDVRHAIDQLENRKDRMSQLGRLYALKGVAYDGLGQLEKVKTAWETAVSFFERHDPPLLRDVAALANNLGFTAKAMGDLNIAEDYFLKALQIIHSEVGQKHAETASISNNLGAVYLAAGYHDQAREMHMMALETRKELFGEHHPDTAQSHNNLALALLKTGDRPRARRHFEKSLEGFEALGVECADDLEAVASNYCDFLKEEGESSLADVIQTRVKKVLAKR